ncbi:MAG: serine/threonine protein kinase, partial [Acetobacteraceae bacterium]
PNILAVHDAGRCTDYAWIVHELVIGETLKAAIERDGAPALPEAVRIMGELLAALAAAHARGIVHRDVKTQTILLLERPGPGLGRVLLTDFGTARLAEAGLAIHGQAPPTPGSLAPEQLRGAPVDHRVDLWGAGIVLYQLLTGTQPFEGAPVSVMQAILEDKVPLPSLRSPGLLPGFDAVIARALAKRPGDRFADAESMAEAIRVAAMPPSVPATRRSHPQGLIGFLRRKRA